jgi:hypothetical protein
MLNPARPLALLLAAAALPMPVAAAEPGYSIAERALVTAVLALAQARSFAEGREVCGYVLRDAAGHLRLTGPVSGEGGTCSAPWPATGDVLASWHTHGGYDVDMWNELPSGRDIQADHLEGVDGWVATPGGRLWHVDGAAMTATLVCGPGCIAQDPDFDAAATGDIGTRYSYWDLVEKFQTD